MGRCMGSLQEGPRSYPQGPHQARRQKEQRCWTQELRHQAPLRQGTPRCRRKEDLRSPQEAQGLIKIVLTMKNTQTKHDFFFVEFKQREICVFLFSFSIFFLSSIFISIFIISERKSIYNKVLIIFLVV